MTKGAILMGLQRKKKLKMTKIVWMHYLKFVFRSILFLSALIVYIYNRIHNTGKTFSGFENNHFLLAFIWTIFIVEMVLRFFPAKLESMGCQKQFKKNYIPTGYEFRLDTAKSTFVVASVWLTLNGIIGVLYLCKIFDRGVMLLIALFYSVCDVICILFFCPFQTWFMKNKCCGTCRIYNWDYAMMFTPLLFVKNAYSWTLLGAALILLIRWEITVHKHPERFMENTNKSLSCASCEEKLCHHKKQLQLFLRKEKFNLKGNILFRKNDE